MAHKVIVGMAFSFMVGVTNYAHFQQNEGREPCGTRPSCSEASEQLLALLFVCRGLGAQTPYFILIVPSAGYHSVYFGKLPVHK